MSPNVVGGVTYCLCWGSMIVRKASVRLPRMGADRAMPDRSSAAVPCRAGILRDLRIALIGVGHSRGYHHRDRRCVRRYSRRPAGTGAVR
jgi:hypothetical protein